MKKIFEELYKICVVGHAFAYLDLYGPNPRYPEGSVK